MRRLLAVLALLPALPALLALPPAHAAVPVPTWDGTCRWNVDKQQTVTGDQWVGFVALHLVATTNGAPAAHITARCVMFVNGVGTDILGPVDNTVPGVVAAAAPSVVTFHDYDYVEVLLCAFIDGQSIGDADGCYHPCLDCFQFPPQWVWDTVDRVVDDVNEAEKVADPTVCAALRAAAPTVNALPGGLLYIDPETGDSFVAGRDEGSMWWDCPPYTS